MNAAQQHNGDSPIGELAERVVQQQQQAIELIGHAMGLKLSIQIEDRLRGHIIEACTWIRAGAPAKALEALETALELV